MAPTVSRRQFLIAAAGTAGAGAAGVAIARHPWLGPGTAPAPRPKSDGHGILVLIGLYGGNDGLNTVIPYQDPAYHQARPNLGYQPDQVLPLGDGLALPSNMKGLKALWDARQLAIVRGVGYADPNRSHFRSMDIWQTATPETAATTGWIGRWLDATGTDPLRALAVGATLPRALAGATASGAAVPIGSLRLPGGTPFVADYAALQRPYIGESPLAQRIAQTGQDLLTVQRTLSAALATPVQGKGTAAGTLGTQLDLVSRLIRGGVPTRVYAVSLPGFDNHATEKNTHAALLGQLDSAVSAFLQSLAGSPRQHDVVVMTYSEFGRRVSENASGGTDHGTAAPLFVAGSAVKGGFYGDEPSLADLDNGDLKFTTDFRSVYATVLARTLGVDPKVSLQKPFPLLAFL